jgi:hypothetical protein
MTQEEKKILLKDLCGRLPYSVKASYYGAEEERECIDVVEGIYPFDNEIVIGQYGLKVEEIKPYLFPLSSMTDKELIEFLKIRGLNLNSDELKTFRNREIALVTTLSLYSRHIDWLNKHHFDYRGLIEKSLALDATGLNIY